MAAFRRGVHFEKRRHHGDDGSVVCFAIRHVGNFLERQHVPGFAFFDRNPGVRLGCESVDRHGERYLGERRLGFAELSITAVIAGHIPQHE